MNSLYLKVQELEAVVQLSKHEQLVQGIINAIADKVVVQGDMLPSVNNMVKEIGFSSKTIVKAYSDLKDRGIIESKNRLGYYVVNEDVEQNVKIALLMFAFHPIQEAFYNSFRKTLGENIQIDIFFHHNNIDVFETILGNIKNQYGKYVIAPIPDPRTSKLLIDIPIKKLLIVDRYEELGFECSHITQEFEKSTYNALVELMDSITNYNEIILFFHPNKDHPIGIKKGFLSFLKDHNIQGSVAKRYELNSIEKNKVYFTIADGDLWNILKDAVAQGFEVGKDIGVLSNNNDPVKEIICGGITTNSTDFTAMGSKAATQVLNKEAIYETVPTLLIRRNSL